MAPRLTLNDLPPVDPRTGMRPGTSDVLRYLEQEWDEAIARRRIAMNTGNIDAAAYQQGRIAVMLAQWAYYDPEHLRLRTAEMTLEVLGESEVRAGPLHIGEQRLEGDRARYRFYAHDRAVEFDVWKLPEGYKCATTSGNLWGPYYRNQEEAVAWAQRFFFLAMQWHALEGAFVSVPTNEGIIVDINMPPPALPISKTDFSNVLEHLRKNPGSTEAYKALAERDISAFTLQPEGENDGENE